MRGCDKVCGQRGLGPCPKRKKGVVQFGVHGRILHFLQRMPVRAGLVCHKLPSHVARTHAFLSGPVCHHPLLHLSRTRAFLP